jgi:hypothetical protein
MGELVEVPDFKIRNGGQNEKSNFRDYTGNNAALAYRV